MSYPQPILQAEVEVGLVLAASIESSERIRPISIDPRALIEVADADNVNFMSEESFRDLVAGIRAHGFGQPVAVYERDGLWYLIDGTHRRRASVLCDLPRVPALQYLQLRPGEEKVLAMCLNRHRGTPQQDVEQRQLAELLTKYSWSVGELSVTGYSESELSALAGLQGAQLSDLTENLGNLTGSGSVPPEADESDDKEPTKMSAVLEIHFERVEDFKLAKRILRKLAKIGGVTKGNRVMETGILALIRQAEAE